MKENLTIKSSLSFREVEAMALKASALSEVHRRQASPMAAPVKRHKPERHSSPVRNLSNIERAIRAIFRSISSRIDEDKTVVTSKTGNGASARWTASVYRTEDLSRQYEEKMLHLPKPFKALPVVNYIFYPDTLNADRLGSVAVYGNGASMRKAAIDRAGHLFGHKVAFTSLEMGRRLFVDVKFATSKI